MAALSVEVLLLIALGLVVSNIAGASFQQRECKPLQKGNSCVVKQHTYYTISSNTGGNLASGQPSTSDQTKATQTNAIYTMAADGDFEKWSFRKAGTGGSGIVAYSITNKETDLALTVADGSLNEDAHFVLSTYAGSPYQKFLIIPASQGDCLLMAMHSGKFLTNNGPPQKSGSPIIIKQKTAGNQTNQLWLFIDSPCDPYPNQPYRIVHRLTEMVVGVRNGATKTAEPVRLLSYNETGDSVSFQFVPVADRRTNFNIYFRHSGKVFDIHGASMQSGAYLVQFVPSGVSHEEFLVEESTSNGWCLISAMHSRRYLAAQTDQQGNYPYGSKVVQLHKTPAVEEHFRLEHNGMLPEENATYRIRNRQSEKFMEINLASTADQASIAQNRYGNDSRHQMWSFKRVPGSINSFQIESKHSRLFLHIETGDEGTPIWQRTPEIGNKQQFLLMESRKNSDRQDRNNADDSHFYRIYSVATKKVLAPIGASTGDCVGISVMTLDNSNLAQEWEIMAEDT